MSFLALILMLVVVLMLACVMVMFLALVRALVHPSAFGASRMMDGGEPNPRLPREDLTGRARRNDRLRRARASKRRTAKWLRLTKVVRIMILRTRVQ